MSLYSCQLQWRPVQPETKTALEKAAKDDMRSFLSLIEKVLIEWLRTNGYLKGKSK
jgi:hypothetical protein